MSNSQTSSKESSSKVGAPKPAHKLPTRRELRLWLLDIIAVTNPSR